MHERVPPHWRLALEDIRHNQAGAGGKARKLVLTRQKKSARGGGCYSVGGSNWDSRKISPEGPKKTEKIGLACELCRKGLLGGVKNEGKGRGKPLKKRV